MNANVQVVKSLTKIFKESLVQGLSELKMNGYTDISFSESENYSYIRSSSGVTGTPVSSQTELEFLIRVVTGKEPSELPKMNTVIGEFEDTLFSVLKTGTGGYTVALRF